MRVRKPSFLKVFERDDEKDHRHLLDDDAATYYEAPPSGAAHVDAESSKEVRVEQAPHREIPPSGGKVSESSTPITTPVPPPPQNPEQRRRSKASIEMGTPRSTAKRVGELSSKPRWVEAPLSPRKFLGGGGRKKEAEVLVNCKEESSSSEDLEYEAAIFTSGGDDDANTFVQFTIEAVAPVENRTGDNKANMEKETETEWLADIREAPKLAPVSVQGVSSSTPKIESKTRTGLEELGENKSTDYRKESQKGGFKPAGNAQSLRKPGDGALAALLMKDKPTVHEEVMTALNMKIGDVEKKKAQPRPRPNLGARKTSNRQLNRSNAGTKCQDSRSNQVEKSSSEHFTLQSEHSMTQSTENSKAPLLATSPVLNPKKARAHKSSSMHHVADKLQSVGKRVASFLPQGDKQETARKNFSASSGSLALDDFMNEDPTETEPLNDSATPVVESKTMSSLWESRRQEAIPAVENAETPKQDHHSERRRESSQRTSRVVPLTPSSPRGSMHSGHAKAEGVIQNKEDDAPLTMVKGNSPQVPSLVKTCMRRSSTGSMPVSQQGQGPYPPHQVGTPESPRKEPVSRDPVDQSLPRNSSRKSDPSHPSTPPRGTNGSSPRAVIPDLNTLPKSPVSPSRSPRRSQPRTFKRTSKKLLGNNSQSKEEVVFSWTRAASKGQSRRLSAPAAVPLKPPSSHGSPVQSPKTPETASTLDVEDESLVELTDGEESSKWDDGDIESKRLVETMEKSKPVNQMFISSFLFSQHGDASVVSGDSKHRRFDSSTHDDQQREPDASNPSTRSSPRPKNSRRITREKVARMQLEHATKRLAEARRVVKTLEEDVAQLTKKLQRYDEKK
jgi:hypothetical protein